ncbi:MAG: hypothetical protein Q9195_006246 [Heterodermia aff. obscurata]
MALTELSAGHIGRNGRAIETPPGSDTSDTRKRAALLRTPNDVAQVTLLPTPASIQGMLRNGTEIGNVGGLALNPNRRPAPSHQLSPSTLPSSVPSSMSKRSYRYRGEAYLDPNEHNMSHGIPPYPASGGIDDGSNPSFIYRNRSQSSSGTQPRGPSKGHNNENGRSYAMMHSSSASRSVPRYPSHINGHLRGHEDPRGMRPRSPLVYPTRLKRPGYRPSSPSLTEIYRSGSRSPVVIDCSTSFRTASPLSAYSVGRPHRWLQGTNRSHPLLAGQQLPLGQSNNNSQYAEGFIRRQFDVPQTYTHAPTSTSAVYFDCPSSIARNQQAVPSVPPLFYDYSEQFQQELDQSRTTVCNVSQALDTVSKGQVHYLSKSSQGLALNEVASIDSSIAGSPKAKTRNSDQTDHMTTRAVSDEAVGFIAMENLDIEITDRELGSTVAGRRSSLKGPVSGLGSVDCFDSTPWQPPEHMRSIAVPRSNSRSQELLAATSRHAVDETVEFLRHGHDASGSSDASRDSLHRFNGESRQFQPDISNALHAMRSPHSGHQLSEPDDDAPKFSFESERGYVKRLSRQSGHAVPSSLSLERSPTVPLCNSDKAKHSNIHAPMPRRSLSSPSNRDRFSGILSIEEGLDESDNLITASKDGSGLSSSIASPDIRQSMIIGGRAPSSHHIAASRHNSPKLCGIAEITIAEPNFGVETDAAGNCQTLSNVTHGAEAQEDVPVQKSPLRLGNVVDVMTQEMRKTETRSFQGHTASAQSSLVPVEPHPVPPSDNAEHRHWALTTQRAPLRTMKELPPLPRNSVVSVAPPDNQNMSSLPFSFTALRHGDMEKIESVTELGKLAASYLDQLDQVGTETPTRLLKDALEARRDENSSPTRPGSRPWNSEENYPWNNQKQQLEITLPVRVSPDLDALVINKAPRFTLKLHRSSTSTTRGVKVAKPRPSNESSVRKQSSTVTPETQHIK